jgi:hypothetical protein
LSEWLWLVVLTVYTERDSGFQPLTLAHGAIPNHTFEFGAIVFTTWRDGECAGGLQIFGTAMADGRLERCGAAVAVPAERRENSL